MILRVSNRRKRRPCWFRPLFKNTSNIKNWPFGQNWSQMIPNKWNGMVQFTGNCLEFSKPTNNCQSPTNSIRTDLRTLKVDGAAVETGLKSSPVDLQSGMLWMLRFSSVIMFRAKFLRTVIFYRLFNWTPFALHFVISDSI